MSGGIGESLSPGLGPPPLQTSSQWKPGPQSIAVQPPPTGMQTPPHTGGHASPVDGSQPGGSWQSPCSVVQL